MTRRMTGSEHSRSRVTKSDLLNALRLLGVRRGDSVAFHASMSAFGWVEGAADTLIDSMLEAIGPEGTLLAPTLTYAANQGPDSPPQFDARTSPSVTGRVPETLRMRPNVVRSLHPTHSWTAVGAKAREMTAGHEDSPSPCGEKSPLGKLVRDGGKVLLLGVDIYNLTFIHYCEEAAGAPYHLQEEPTHVVMLDNEGERVERCTYLHRWGHEWYLERLRADALRAGAIRTCSVGDAVVTLVDTRTFSDIVIDKVRRDPHYLLLKK